MTSDARTATTAERVSLPLRVPPELRKRAKADAGRFDRSMNEHLIVVLDEHLPQLDPQAVDNPAPVGR